MSVAVETGWSWESAGTRKGQPAIYVLSPGRFNRRKFSPEPHIARRPRVLPDGPAAVPDVNSIELGNDAQCIERVLRGDEQAARVMMDRLYPLILKIVRCRLPRRTLEEDLVQGVFLKVFRSLAQFSGRVPLEHWVSRIAINTCINQLKHEAGRPEYRMSDLSEEQEAVVQHLASTEAQMPFEQGQAARELLDQLLSQLSPPDRLIITLLHLEERSIEEIGRLTGWSVSRVKVRAFRARHKLRRNWNALLKKERR